MTHSTKSIARSTITRTWGDPGSTSTPAAAPAAAPAVAASGSSGVSGAAGGVTPAGGGSIAGAMHQAAAAAGIPGGGTLGSSGVQSTAGGTGQTNGAPGAAGGVGSGQPGAPGAAAATPAPVTLDSLLAAHPQLLAEHRAQQQTHQEAMRWAQWAQQEYTRQQQAARNPQTQGTGTPAAAAKTNLFGIPEFDKGLLKTFTRGQDGSLQPGPFTPPGAIYAYQQYQEARVEAMEKFLDDPMSFFEPAMKKLIEGHAPQMAQQQIGNVQNSAFANNYVQENGAWLFVQGQNGQPQRDGFGRPVLSEHGKRFGEICTTLHSQGVTDIRIQQQIAEQIVFGQAAIARLQNGQAAQTQHQQGNQNLLSAAAAGLNQPQPGNGASVPSIVPNQQPITGNGVPGVRRMKNAMLDAAQRAGIPLEGAAAV